MTKLRLLINVADDDSRLLLTQIGELMARAKRLDLTDTVFC